MSICTFHVLGSKHSKAYGKQVFEVFIQCYCLHGIPSVFHLRRMKKIGCRYVRQPNVVIAFFLFQNPFILVGPFKLIKTLLKSLHDL